jgi:CHAT domain-containing protein
MLAAGYRGVVATMWSINDFYGPQVAEDFYSNLICLSTRGKEMGLSSAGAARALHFAIQGLQQKIGHSKSACYIWVPYVHFGV